MKAGAMSRAWAVCGRHRWGAASAAYLLLLIIVGLCAGWIAPFPHGQQDLRDVLSGPSSAHWLGTDTLGRDLLSQLIYSIRPSLVATAEALAVFLAVGVSFGILAGYRRGAVDAAISRFVELVQSIPAIIVILVVLGVFGSSVLAAMVTLGLLASTGLVRVARGTTLAVREELFVTAAQVSGVPPARIMRTHVLRRIMGPVLAQASVFAGISLVVQAALSFLGLLQSGSHPTWGAMIGEASRVISRATWPLIPPGVAIAVTVLALGALGDALRDVAAGETGPAQRHHRRRAPVSKDVNTHVGSTSGVAALEPSSSDGLLEVRDFSLAAFNQQVPLPLVTGVTFAVHRGETLALVGESGCGKSITALGVMGLLPPGIAATSGQVRFGGIRLTPDDQGPYREVRGRGIGFVSQHVLASLDPTHTVGSHLREAIRRHEPMPRKAATVRALELLEQVKLSEPGRVLVSYPYELSGGMSQRAAIALAIAGRPRLLIADEPTTALDVTLQAEILALLRDLQRTDGLAILLITHDWGVVADMAHRVAVMYAGQIVEQADIHTAFARPRFPYTLALISADPSTAAPGERLPAVDGRVPPPGSWPRGCRFADRCAYGTDRCTSASLSLEIADTGSLTRCVRSAELVSEGVLP
ncbi:dipeptide/oligopeptide/nickel ABC transporter permease/ATP-binding protein [Candidatus Poriferisodalis sp.]|uniref:dipeptide/oligopeptide/nickel ABC transporter permease/ATP-binding protein n=1 Tax=Candidatus Poriferisodalis sp. TaxID=3101277 RepID=UPI003B01D135